MHPEDRQVNALTPGELGSRVRNSTSDPGMLPPIPIAAQPGPRAGKSPAVSDPTANNDVGESISKKTRVSPATSDLPVLPLKLRCVYVCVCVF